MPRQGNPTYVAVRPMPMMRLKPRPQTGAGIFDDIDQFFRDTKVLSSVGGAGLGLLGGAIGGPMGAAAAGSVGTYALRQTGYGPKRKKPKKKAPKRPKKVKRPQSGGAIGQFIHKKKGQKGVTFGF